MLIIILTVLAIALCFATALLWLATVGLRFTRHETRLRQRRIDRALRDSSTNR